MVTQNKTNSESKLLDSVEPCSATLSSKIHGFFLYLTHLLIFSKGYVVRCLSKREDDNGLNRQLGKPRIVYDPFFFGGGGQGAGVVYRGGVTVKDV